MVGKDETSNLALLLPETPNVFQMMVFELFAGITISTKSLVTGFGFVISTSTA